MDEVFVKACFKIGSEEHMKQLLLEGKVCMNSVSYFRTLEGEQGDPHEGAFFCKQATGARLSSDGRDIGEG